MTNIITEDITFPVAYADETVQLHGRVFRPAKLDADAAKLPPVVFNSGFTGGVSMYGQLFGRALAERGYQVMTFDVAGFFTNKAVRNTFKDGQLTVTNVSLDDQKAEVLAAAEWTRQQFGKMPVVASWAMGSVASLAAIAELAAAGGPQIAFWVPMNYTRITALQALRADPSRAHEAISTLDDNAAIPPFDTGTEATALGYYPLDPATQDYVEVQLGNYTDIGGVDHWPGCSHVTAKSYKCYVAFNPEEGLEGASGFPPALIIHGAQNTLHMPSESVRLHQRYPGDAGPAALVLPGMMHGQQNQPESEVFQSMITLIDQAVRQHI